MASDFKCLANQSQAFDKVTHSRLLYKLDHYGGNLLNWLKSFLSDSSQQIVVDGIKSLPCAVTSRVPKGSILGRPSTVLINEIVSNVE